jgi:hypothetical protein
MSDDKIIAFPRSDLTALALDAAAAVELLLKRYERELDLCGRRPMSADKQAEILSALLNRIGALRDALMLIQR